MKNGRENYTIQDFPSEIWAILGLTPFEYPEASRGGGWRGRPPGAFFKRHFESSECSYIFLEVDHVILHNKATFVEREKERERHTRAQTEYMSAYGGLSVMSL